MTLKALNPTGTGKLVLFETNYGTTYQPYHYVVFVVLGVAGGIFGGSVLQSKLLLVEELPQIQHYQELPRLLVFLVVLATAVLQYPNPLTREPGDVIIKNLLVDCSDDSSASYVCVQEQHGTPTARYLGWLLYGTLVKLVLTIITAGN